jgi:heat shock protein HtpX
MAATGLGVDAGNNHEQVHHNRLDTVLLIGGIALLTGLTAAQFFGWLGAVAAVMLAGSIGYVAPHVPAIAVMRLYRASPVDPRTGGELYLMLNELTLRSGLQRAPALYVVPSLALNAFSAGEETNAAIALTEGLLRALDLRETAGVIAHEFSHIVNRDLRIMALADVMSRYLQVLSWVALVLVLIYLPSYLAGDHRIPWLGLLLLYLAPSLGSLLQLALARTREFDADREAARLTGDPEGLAKALTKIERYQGHFWEDLIFPGARRVPVPSMLRTHPETEERVKRMRAVARTGAASTWPADGPRISLVGMGPGAMRPRFRIPGLWF